MRSNQQNSCVPKKKEADQTEFEQFPIPDIKIIRDLEDELQKCSLLQLKLSNRSNGMDQ